MKLKLPSRLSQPFVPGLTESVVKPARIQPDSFGSWAENNGQERSFAGAFVHVEREDWDSVNGKIEDGVFGHDLVLTS
jgi:hypothetical protein